MRTPDEIRDVPADQRTPAELYQYGTDGPWPGRPLPVVSVPGPREGNRTYYCTCRRLEALDVTEIICPTHGHRSNDA